MNVSSLNVDKKVFQKKKWRIMRIKEPMWQLDVHHKETYALGIRLYCVNEILF